MLHLIYLRDSLPLAFCGYEHIPDVDSRVHISWASEKLINSPEVCIMCYTEWSQTVDELERRIRNG